MLPAISSCGVGMWPQEREVWWSRTAGRAGKHQDGTPMPISEEALQDWLADTVGWAGIELSAESFMAAAVHISQVKPLVLAAFEAAARLNTHKCRFKQVDIDSTLARCVSMALAAYANIQVLVLQELNVYEEAVQVLTSGLRNSENLTKLSLQTVDLSIAGWESVARAVAFSPSLRHVKIRGSFPRHALVSLCHGLRHCTMLQVLDVGSNPLGNQGIIRLCDTLVHNTTIKTLKIQSCSFEAHGAVAVGRLLRGNKHLTHLHVDQNELGAEGCLDIAKAVGASSSLQHLSASRTGWDDAAVQQLCASLSTCPTLSTVDFSFGRVTMKGSHLLSAAALKADLVAVKLSGNCSIGTEGVKSWAQVIGMPHRPLAQLSLSDCEAADPAAFAIAGALRQVGDQGGLETLELASNHLTSSGVGELIKAVRCSPTMRMLDVSFNWLGPRAMGACLHAPPEEPSAEVTASSKPVASSSFLSFLAIAPRPKKTETVTQSACNYQCEIKSEVLQEFREIEQIKISEWPQAAAAAAAATQQPQQQAEQQQQEQADEDANPFLTGDKVEPHSSNGHLGVNPAGREEAADLLLREQNPSGESAVAAPPLRAGYAIPARLACGDGTSGNGSETAASTETFASSGRSLLGSVAGSAAESHSRQQGSETGHEGFKPGAGVPEPVLEQLQGLQDGTINSDLPVSLKPRESAGSAEFAVVTPQTPVRANAQVDTESSNPFVSVNSSSAGGYQPSALQRHASSGRYDARTSAAGLIQQAKPGGSNQQTVFQETETTRPGRSPSLTSESLRRLNQQLGPVSVGELLLLDTAKQQALVSSLGGAVADSHADVAPQLQQMRPPTAPAAPPKQEQLTVQQAQATTDNPIGPADGTITSQLIGSNLTQQSASCVLTSIPVHDAATVVATATGLTSISGSVVASTMGSASVNAVAGHGNGSEQPPVIPERMPAESKAPIQQISAKNVFSAAAPAQQPSAALSNPFASEQQPSEQPDSHVDNPFLSESSNGHVKAAAHAGVPTSSLPSTTMCMHQNGVDGISPFARPPRGAVSNTKGTQPIANTSAASSAAGSVQHTHSKVTRAAALGRPEVAAQLPAMKAKAAASAALIADTDDNNPFGVPGVVSAASSADASSAVDTNPFKVSAINGPGNNGSMEDERQQQGGKLDHLAVTATVHSSVDAAGRSIASGSLTDNPFLKDRSSTATSGKAPAADSTAQTDSNNPFASTTVEGASGKLDNSNPFATSIVGTEAAHTTTGIDAASVNPFLSRGDATVEDALVMVSQQPVKGSKDKALKTTWAGGSKRQEGVKHSMAANATQGHVEAENPFLAGPQEHQAANAGTGTGHATATAVSTAVANPFLQE